MVSRGKLFNHDIGYNQPRMNFLFLALILSAVLERLRISLPSDPFSETNIMKVLITILPITLVVVTLSVNGKLSIDIYFIINILSI